MFKRVFAIAAITGLALLLVAPAPASADGRGGWYRHHGYGHAYRYHRYHRYDYYDRYYYRPYPYYYGAGPCWYGGAPRNVVLVRCHAFAPHRVFVPVGASVVWWFADYGVPHTVTAEDGSVDSGPRRGGDFRLVFDHPGEFRYFCAIHPEMRGSVVVG